MIGIGIGISPRLNGGNGLTLYTPVFYNTDPTPFISAGLHSTDPGADGLAGGSQQSTVQVFTADGMNSEGAAVKGILWDVDAPDRAAFVDGGRMGITISTGAIVGTKTVSSARYIMGAGGYPTKQTTGQMVNGMPTDTGTRTPWAITSYYKGAKTRIEQFWDTATSWMFVDGLPQGRTGFTAPTTTNMQRFTAGGFSVSADTFIPGGYFVENFTVSKTGFTYAPHPDISSVLFIGDTVLTQGSPQVSLWSPSAAKVTPWFPGNGFQSDGVTASTGGAWAGDEGVVCEFIRQLSRGGYLTDNSAGTKNQGIANATFATLKTRVETLSSVPKLVVLIAGTQDIITLRTESAVYDDLKAIVDHLVAEGAERIVISMPPSVRNRAAYANDTTDAVQRGINSALTSIAAYSRNVVLVNTFDAFGRFFPDATLFQGGGNEDLPNAKGSTLIGQLLGQAAVASLSSSYSFAGLDNTYYIDPDAGSEGVGTQASPFNSLTKLRSITGDRGGEQWLIKAGTTIHSYLEISNASNFHIGKYSTGADPHITLATAWTGTWTETAPGSKKWTMTHAFGNVAPIVNGLQAEWREYASGTAALALTYECNEYNSRTFPYTHTYTGTTTTLYLDDGLDPNAQTITKSGDPAAAHKYVVHLNACSDFTVSDLQVSGSGADNFKTGLCNDFTLNNIDSFNAGCGNLPGGIGQDCFVIAGSSNAVRSTGITLNNCTGRRSIQRNCNAFEFNFIDGLTINGGSAMDVRGNAFEFYESCSNVTIDGVEVRQAASLFKLFDVTPGTTVHSDFTVTNCLLVQGESYNYDHLGRNTNSGGAESGFGVVLSGAAANYSRINVINNTFYLSDNSAINTVATSADQGDGTVKFRNNLLIQRTPDAVQRYPMLQIGGNSAGGNTMAALIDSDYNVFQAYRTDYFFTIGNASATGDTPTMSLANLKARWVTVGASNDTHSLGYTNATTLILDAEATWPVALADLSLSSGSPCINAGNSIGAPATDFAGRTRDTSPDVGAYEGPL